MWRPEQACMYFTSVINKQPECGKVPRGRVNSTWKRPPSLSSTRFCQGPRGNGTKDIGLEVVRTDERRSKAQELRGGLITVKYEHPP